MSAAGISQATPYTVAILERLKNDTAHAPALWLLELANVARTSVIRSKFTPEQAADVLALITKLPITVDRSAGCSLRDRTPFHHRPPRKYALPDRH